MESEYLKIDTKEAGTNREMVLQKIIWHCIYMKEIEQESLKKAQTLASLVSKIKKNQELSPVP